MIIETPLYKRTAKKYRKKNYTMGALEEAVHALDVNDRQTLQVKHNDHKLYQGDRILHVAYYNDNWLLKYRREKGRVVLLAVGGHNDL